MILTKTKTKTTILLALVSTTFILSIISYAILQPQQVFGQGVFQPEQQPEQNQLPPDLIIEEANNDTGVTESTTTATTKDNEKIILDDITIPITPNTSLSLELPDSKITVQPNK